MARKRKYRYIIDPITKAAVVIESFVSNAKKKVDTWSTNYKNNIKAYTTDEARQVFAALKLAGFYQGLSDPEVKSAIRDAINKAKEKQAEVVSAALPKVPTPVVPAEASATAKKVAEIISTVTAETPSV